MENKNEYYAIIDGEEIKVDYCFSNLLGASYCECNGYTYENVPHRTVIVEKQYNNDNIFQVISGFLFVIIFILIAILIYDSF